MSDTKSLSRDEMLSASLDRVESSLALFGGNLHSLETSVLRAEKLHLALTRASVPVVLFTAAVVIQTFHMVEHVAQVVQKFMLSFVQADGLLGALFNQEWVHFWYNAALLGLVVAAYFGFRKADGAFQSYKMAYRAYVAAVAIQAYHLFEHVVKVEQHIQTGLQGTPGILGNFVNPIMFHFTINLLVYLPLLTSFFLYGFNHDVGRLLRERVALTSHRYIMKG